MPEGHTIHRIARYQQRMLAGKTLAVSSPQGRFTAGAKKVHRHTLQSVEALGKHLFYHFGPGTAVHVHLGMHGRYRYARFEGKKPPPARGQVRMRLVTGDRVVDLSGPTACEVIDDKKVQSIRDRIGPDLLSDKPDADAVWQRISTSRAPIGTLLMDQSVLSGIGNAYRSEVLYRQKLHPRQPGNTLSREQFDALWKDAIHLLKLGVKQGIMVTVDPSEREKPDKAYKRRDRDRFYIYRREKCLRCGATVNRFEMAGRTVYVCPKEQPQGKRTKAKAVKPKAGKAKTTEAKAGKAKKK